MSTWKNVGRHDSAQSHLVVSRQSGTGRPLTQETEANHDELAPRNVPCYSAHRLLSTLVENLAKFKAVELKSTAKLLKTVCADIYYYSTWHKISKYPMHQVVGPPSFYSNHMTLKWIQNAISKLSASKPSISTDETSPPSPPELQDDPNCSRIRIGCEAERSKSSYTLHALT